MCPHIKMCHRKGQSWRSCPRLAPGTTSGTSRGWLLSLVTRHSGANLGIQAGPPSSLPSMDLGEWGMVPRLQVSEVTPYASGTVVPSVCRLFPKPFRGFLTPTNLSPATESVRHSLSYPQHRGAAWGKGDKTERNLKLFKFTQLPISPCIPA